jgi:hypothetical protein
MSRKLKIGIVIFLIVGAGVVAGFAVWRLGGPFGPERELVGVWDIESGQETEEAVQRELEKKAPQAAEAARGKFRSTERIHFDRGGECRLVQDLLGMTITTQGTWQLTRTDGDKLLVTFHKKKLSVRDQKGQTNEEPQDDAIEWIVTVIDFDHLSVTMTTDDGKSQSFRMRRAKD